MVQTTEMLAVPIEPGAEQGFVNLELSDAEVDERFADLVERLDANTSPQQEALLDAVPTRKTNGTAESYDMWKP